MKHRSPFALHGVVRAPRVISLGVTNENEFATHISVHPLLLLYWPAVLAQSPNVSQDASKHVDAGKRAEQKLMAGSDLNCAFFLCATIKIENLDLIPFQFAGYLQQVSGVRSGFLDN
jgi:hypothetical protein